jgi:uncharacterized protein (TIGR03086 family)
VARSARTSPGDTTSTSSPKLSSVRAAATAANRSPTTAHSTAASPSSPAPPAASSARFAAQIRRNISSRSRRTRATTATPAGRSSTCRRSAPHSPASSTPSRADGVPDDGWPAAYRAASQRAKAAWADDAKLDALVEAPWGKIPGRFAIAGYVQEILTHGWDLAKATGQPTERDPELAFFALAGAKRILPPETRGDDIPFAPVVPVPPDGAPYAQLAAWLGRQP